MHLRNRLMLGFYASKLIRSIVFLGLAVLVPLPGNVGYAAVMNVHLFECDLVTGGGTIDVEPRRKVLDFQTSEIQVRIAVPKKHESFEDVPGLTVPG